MLWYLSRLVAQLVIIIAFFDSLLFFFFFSLLPRPLTSSLFPYTTLFRSDWGGGGDPPHRALPPSLPGPWYQGMTPDRKSTRLNSSHEWISYAVFCLKKKKPMRRDRTADIVNDARDSRRTPHIRKQHDPHD